MIVGLGVAIIAVMLVFRRLLFSVVTDEDWSRVVGLPVGFAEHGARGRSPRVAVVAAMQIVGHPADRRDDGAAGGERPADRDARSGARCGGRSRSASGSVIAGLAVSRIWGLAPGGTIVLITAGVFALVAIVTRGVAPRLLLPVDETADQEA